MVSNHFALFPSAQKRVLLAEWQKAFHTYGLAAV